MEERNNSKMKGEREKIQQKYQNNNSYTTFLIINKIKRTTIENGHDEGSLEHYNAVAQVGIVVMEEERMSSPTNFPA